VLEDVSGDAGALGDTPVAAALAAALAHGETPPGDAACERALEAARELGHRAVFLELGPALVPLLRRRVRERSPHAPLARELLDAFEGKAPARPAAALTEPLSERERAVVRLLPTALSNPEIAAELLVTTNTVKTHLRSAYRKLGASGRRDAVARARALGLLAGHGRPAPQRQEGA